MSIVCKSNGLNICAFSRETKIADEAVFLTQKTLVLFNIHPVIPNSISVTHPSCIRCMGYVVKPMKPTIAV